MVACTKGWLTLIAIIATYLIVSNNNCQAELPFGSPKANADLQGLVSFDLVQKIAMKRSKALWGQVAVGEALPCVDDDGDIVAYMFPVAIGKNSFPDYSEISSRIEYGRKITEKGYDVLNDADKQSVKDYIINNKRNLDTASSVPTGQSSNGSEDIYNKTILDIESKNLGRQVSIGAEEYGTIVVSARYDRYPLPYYTNYLPPYHFNGDLAVKTAADSLSSKFATLEKIYFLENLQTLFIEFSSNESKVLMNAHSLNIESFESVLILKGKKITPLPEEQSQITAEWKKVKKEVE